MAVTVTVTRPAIQHIAAHPSKRLPIGRWFVRVQAVGDASGGLLMAQFVPTTAIMRRYCWSWTICGFDKTQAALPRILWYMGIPETGEAGSIYTTMISSGNGGVASGASAGWQGTQSLQGINETVVRPSRQGGGAFEWRAEVANGATEALQLLLGGYLWDKDVMDVPGGPALPRL